MLYVNHDSILTPSLEQMPEPTTAIVGSFKKEKEQCIELGFVAKEKYS